VCGVIIIVLIITEEECKQKHLEKRPGERDVENRFQLQLEEDESQDGVVCSCACALSYSARRYDSAVCCSKTSCDAFLSKVLFEAESRLRSASSLSLHVPRSLHRTIGDRAFPVAAAKVWNALPPAITSLPSLGAFKHALKTELFRRSYGNANYRPQ